VRVLGYIREAVNPEYGDSAFAQAERIRRWVTRNGYTIIAMCQDPAGGSRDGFRTLLAIVAAGDSELVVLPSLATLSPDKITQELMLWQLRSRRIPVASADEADLEALADPPLDPARLLIRDVLHRLDDYRDVLRPAARPLPAPAPTEQPATEPDVLIEMFDAPVEVRAS
jgi:hypothetical protein